MKKNVSKINLYIYFFYLKASNFHDSVVVGRRKLPDLSLNNIFGALLIGLKYTLSFKEPDLGLKGRVSIKPKGQSLLL